MTEEASSRQASALLTSADGAPEVSVDQMLVESDMAASPQQPAEFELPPELAVPPDQLCSAAVQVGPALPVTGITLLFSEKGNC